MNLRGREWCRIYGIPVDSIDRDDWRGFDDEFISARRFARELSSRVKDGSKVVMDKVERLVGMYGY